ncbi:PDR/VanB family oxidoreductase [Actinomadura chibensis]|uniref:Oxidoreductase n=1 Tax=Actinomadura chibensis TaxID=392828 RepID=A0A5D0NI96_9ACTN|nr:PDR/VanB family oxidoreductase [Actinomadura chibensis]TYB43995.1 oxidoreductase [Actinomadura chibensis]
MRLLVKQIRWESDSVVSLTLVDPDGAELPAWEPGAHVEVRLPTGLVRHYSLCGEVDDRTHYRVAVLREPESRGGSRFVHEELRVGARLEIGGPRNRFPFTPSARVEFVAGGVGITPILPMVREAERRGLDWRLWYGGRAASSMAFVDELSALGPGRVRLFAADRGESIDLDAALGRPAGDAAVYCCGPEPLLRAVQDRCAAAWPEGSLHYERFVAPKAAEAPAAEGEADVFVVVAQVSGAEVKVPPGKSVLEALEEANVAAPFSCREGICGTCEVPVVEGVPDHRDLVLDDDERRAGNSMMICVSRAKSRRLVIGL